MYPRGGLRVIEYLPNSYPYPYQAIILVKNKGEEMEQKREQKRTPKTDSKIIQIMEVTKEVYAVYEEEDGTEYFQPIFLATLDDEGIISLHPETLEGFFFEGAMSSVNFLRYHYGPRTGQGGKSQGRG